MRADVGVASRRAADPPETVQAGGRTLLIVGAVVAAVAAFLYVVALATHPMDAMLKGFDLQVYLGGAHEALHQSHSLYTWEFEGHPGIQFTYTPFAALVFAPGLKPHFTLLMSVATIVSLFSLVATIWIAFRQLGWEKTSRLGATMLLSGLLLWTEPIQRALFLGQVELALMALIVWDLCQPDRRPWKGAVTGIAAGIKLVPLLFIVYLLLTRRFKQAAVAAGAFVVTVIIGFIALPNASVTWWLDGNFFQAGRTGFVGSEQNQSLRGIMTRLIGSVNGTVAPWLLVAIVVGLLGLAAAVMLDQRGYTFAGLMAAALTALLISPISWDHHWVWIAPGLALIVDAAVRAGRAGQRGLQVAWYALAAVALLLFAAWPDRLWNAKAGLLQGGLINYAPSASFPSGDNPAYKEYHWHGLQLITGNLELLAGLGLFVVLIAVAVHQFRSARLAPR
jgi:alpha-1,2-mannosyltransferase